MWVSLCLSYLGLNVLPGLECLFIAFIRLGKYSATISLNRFSVSLSFPSGTSIIWVLWLILFQRSLKFWLFFFLLLACLPQYWSTLPYHWICWWFSLVFFSFPLFYFSALICSCLYSLSLCWTSHCVPPFLSWVKGVFKWLITWTIYLEICFSPFHLVIFLRLCLTLSLGIYFFVSSLGLTEHWRTDAFELWCWRRLFLESPLDSKKIKPISPKRNQLWIFIGRTDGKAEALILWPPDVKSWLIWKDSDAGKDWRQEEKGMTEHEMVGGYHWLSGQEFEQIQGDNEGQGRLMCCSPWGRKESETI